jgi:hypothetical protein
MGAITDNTKRLIDVGQQADQAFAPKKKKPVVPIPKPIPPPTTAIPTEDQMKKTIAGFKQKGWIK